MLGELKEALQERNQAAVDLEQKAKRLSEHEESLRALSESLETLRSDYMDLETSYSGFQNELTQLESGRRSDIVRLERLAAERVALEEESKNYEERRTRMGQEFHDAETETAKRKSTLEQLAAEHAEIQKSLNEARANYSGLQAEIAARRVQTELVGDGAADARELTGSTLLLDQSNPLDIQEDAVLGALSDLLETDPQYERALAAVIRSWLDAVVVGNASAALTILDKLRARDDNSVRLVVADLTPQPNASISPEGPASPLLQHVRYPENIKAVVAQLLQNVFVVESLDSAPSAIPVGAAYVALDGSVAKGGGIWEFWTRHSRPAIGKRLLAELQKDLPNLERRCQEAQQNMTELELQVEHLASNQRNAQTALDQHRHIQAVKQGEIQVVSKEAEQARDRLKTVAWELSDFEKRDGLHDQRETEINAEMVRITERRDKVKAAVDVKAVTLRAMEQERSTISSEAIEARLRHSKSEHKVELREEQIMPMRTRLRELEELVTSRSDGIVSRTNEIGQLRAAVEQARQQITSL
jgi:chromosome segregation protein